MTIPRPCRRVFPSFSRWQGIFFEAKQKNFQDFFAFLFDFIVIECILSPRQARGLTKPPEGDKVIKTNRKEKTMKKYIVILTDDTVGKLEAEEVHAGDTVEVELTDENGGMVRKTGTVASVEDKKEMWQ